METKKKSGGSALKQLKQQFQSAGVTQSRISKKAPRHKREAAQATRRQATQQLRATLSKPNPFEQRTHKLKHSVFNDSKRSVGMPGVTQKRGELARKRTLLVELKKKNKDASFTDRRFGEHNPTLSSEQRQLERFVKEKAKQALKKKSIYNLEEDSLTHMGQSLDSAADYVPPLEDDENMSKDIVSELHFSGKIHKSRAEIMQEVISKSKMYKAERQQTALENKELAESADAEYDSIMSILQTQKKDVGTVKEEKVEDEFDKAVKELAMDRKARATDRIMTQDEIVAREAVKLKMMEMERVKKLSQDAPKRAPQGDDLDDLVLEEEEEDMPLTYKDGVLINKDIFLSSNIKNARMRDQEDGSENEEESDDGESEEDGSEEEGSEEVDSEEVSEEEDDAEIEEFDESKIPDGNEDDELPYVFEAPTSHAELLNLFKNKTNIQKSTILERIRVLYHAKSNPANADTLKLLIKILIEHVKYVTSNSDSYTDFLADIRVLRAHLVPMVRQFPQDVTEYVSELMQDMRVELVKKLSSNSNGWPSIENILVLKVLGEVYSKEIHPVITPGVLLISQYLTQCTLKSEKDVCIGLLLSQLALEWTPEFIMPEVLDYLGLVIDVYSGDDGDRRFIKKITGGTGVKVLESLITGKNGVELIPAVKEVVKSVAEGYKDSPGFVELFTPVVEKLRKIGEPVENVETMIKERQLRVPLCLQKRKAKAISSMAPRISSRFAAKDSDKKLKKDYKREYKGAVRELRKDAGFISRVKSKEKRVKDERYKKKMGRIVGSLAQQEGDIKRMKKRK